MDEEKTLQSSLDEHKFQLAAVEAALPTAKNREELIGLKNSLEEVISLTEESLLTVRKKNLLSAVDNIEEEFARFQAEISNLTPAEDSLDVAQKGESLEENKALSEDQQLQQYLSELDGSSCRAPYIQPWGELAYHNALIIGVEAKEAKTVEDVTVFVLFLNPTCREMRTCQYILEGHCKFTSDRCKFSHGYPVKLSRIQEFTPPNYNLLKRDALCLAKNVDEIWYKAIVQEIFDENKIKVKYTRQNKETILDIENIVPLEDQPKYEQDLNEMVSVEQSLNDTIQIQETPQLSWSTSANAPVADWEKHTKGFGSKLMEQMGYIKGQGLGRQAQGITQPVEATVLPQGKSLDKIMEMREQKEDRNQDLALKKVKHKEQALANQVAAGYNLKPKKKNVFDFLNKKLEGKPGGNAVNIADDADFKKLTSKVLNVQSVQVTQDISKAEKEMKRLQEALLRNKDKDRVIKSQLESKISMQERLIEKLKTKEKAIGREQSTRSDTRKITVF